MIRVLRVLEYEYADVQTQLKDMERWTTQLSMYSQLVKMRSAVVSITFEGKKDE